MAKDDEDSVFEYTDMDAKVAQEKMTERHAKSNKDDDPVTLEELDDEPVMKIEGGDDEWEAPEEGADLDYTGDKEEEKEEEVEEEVEEKEVAKEEKKELTAEEKADKEAMDAVIHYLDEEGGGTKYKVKGREYDLRDLSPQEFKDRFSKAGRFHERMEELAQKEKTLTERERLAEQGARQSQEIMRRYGGEGKADKVEIPDAYKVHEDDMDEVKALKQGYADLYTTVKNLEQGYQQQVQTVTHQELQRQLDTLVQEFPMASKEEIVAVKYNYPDADLRTIAENSHNNRINDQYIDAVFNARPDKLREIEEKAIEKFLAKKQKATKIPRKKASTTVSSKASSATKKTPRTFDEIEAHLDAFKKDMSSFDED